MIISEVAKQTRIDYWDMHYKEKGKIYGEHPSYFAKNIFTLISNNNGNAKLLELACGYGRNSILFAQNGLQVIGVDMSLHGLEIGENDRRKSNLGNIQFVQQDILEMNNSDEFNVVFSNFIFHLFYEDERESLYQKSYQLICKGGIFVNSFLSIDDSDYGIGKEIEMNTFIKKEEPEKPQHFFSKEEVEELHERNELIIESMKPDIELESLIYKGIERETHFWNVIARKR